MPLRRLVAPSPETPAPAEGAPPLPPELESPPAEPVVQTMPLVTPVSVSRIQLTPEQVGPVIVQRAATTVATAPSPAAVEPSTVDLEQLARRIYPILKRMLAVERERRFSW
jgi:hypothetical protein